MTKSLEKLIEGRIKEARELNLPHKIGYTSYILGELCYTCFDYDHYTYTESGLTLITKIYYHPIIRLISHKDTKAIYGSNREVFSETDSKISGYFPGKWLEILDLLYEKARGYCKTNHPKQRLLCRRDEGALRKRFGL